MISVIVPIREHRKDVPFFTKNIFELCYANLDNYELIYLENSKDSASYMWIYNFIAKGKKCNSPIRLIKTSFSKGYRRAVLEGIRQSRGDYVSVISADLADRVSDINKMMNKIKMAGVNVVIGNRNHSLCKGRNDLKSLKGFISIMGSLAIRRMLRLRVHDLTNSFRLYDRKSIENLKEGDFTFSGRVFSYELLLRLLTKGYSFAEVDTYWAKRKYGKSNFNLFDFWQYLYVTLLYFLGVKK